MKKTFPKQQSLILIFTSFYFLYTGCTGNISQRKTGSANKTVEIVAHRGANWLAPENTFASAQKALESGASYIEIDLRKSKDGIYYLFHDKTLNRTTNDTGLFAKTYSTVIDTLDAGIWFLHQYAGEKIPRFTDMLEWAKGKVKLYIDVKDINIQDVVTIIEDYSMQDDCFFYFRDPEDIKTFRQLAPSLNLKMNAATPQHVDSLVKIYKPQIIETSPEYLTDDLVKACHGHGLKIMVYVPGNDWDNYKKVMNHNIDLVQVDHPDIFKAMLDNGGKMESYKLIAHRGGIVEGIYNEFDPRSIQAAIDSGYYMLEIDVRESKDGMLVVNHDPDFRRFFGNPSKVIDLTWKEIQQLRSDKGNYHPMSFEDLAKMCSGKIKLMMDIKPSGPDPEFYAKLEKIMGKYGLIEDSYFIDNEARKYFNGKAKFEFRTDDAMEILEKIKTGEDISSNYFLFDHGNRLTAEAVKWCQKNHIEVIVSVNIGHYVFENHLEGAKRDIDYWKKCGVILFQIDSDYDKWLPHKVTALKNEIMNKYN